MDRPPVSLVGAQATLPTGDAPAQASTPPSRDVPVGAPRLVAFDLETTGLDAERARIVEFCFIELDPDLRELGRWSELVHPGMPIPEDTVKVHGITDGMVLGKPTFRHHAARIQALVQDAILVAHNHKFDLQILSRELTDAGQRGLAPTHPCIDTWQVEAFVNSHSLGETYQRYTGKSLEGAHRSAADTEATVEVLRNQRTRHAARLPANIDGLVVASLMKQFRPESADKQWLDHGRRFYADAKGMIRFGFGKFRDCPALQPHDCTKEGSARRMEHKEYLAWMRDKGDFPGDVKALILTWIGPSGKVVPAR